MKKNFTKHLLLFSLLAGIYSCDYVSNPVEPTTNNNGESCISTAFPATTPFRKVLVEDYTGHKCPNCPQAAVSIKKLEQTFHDSVICIAVHADFFAKPDTKYPEDFRTEAGEKYAVTFGFSGYPNGLVNRKDYPSNAVKAHTSWLSEVSTILRTAPEADVKLLSEYNSVDSSVCVNIQTKLLSTPSSTASYNLCLMLVQDSIVAPQLDGTTFIANYLHRHVLRDNINGIWGDSVLTNAKQGEPRLKKYKFKLQHDYKKVNCKPKDCYLVAFLFDNSNYRILQAEEIKIIK
ncbi:MAG TPA: Omp28 family outer membrane lipoprotein [Bacteroidia bacterium]|jgi:thiol-disulfide isomerase/thioredoxin|nr:Omp28 family outer membrane lipoprotein [Bacteroidia bacterium]HRG52041.1 Omp28 family outer membrane lipoprotein [Bacteroidia bacterium]